MTTLSDAPKSIDGLPPSCKLTWLVLREHAPATQEDLCQQTRLPKRTVRYAASRLADQGLITEEIDVGDTRQKVYTVEESAISAE